MLPEPNPWTGIDWDHTIASCDLNCDLKIGKKIFQFGSEEYVQFINRKDKESDTKVGLSFDCLPEPFSGDINSEVYCLNMNPGAPDKGFSRGTDRNGDYVHLAQGILSHNLANHYFDDLVVDENGIKKDSKRYSECMDRIFSGKNLKDYKENRAAFSPRPHDGAVWQREMWGPMKKAIGEMEKREGKGKGEGHFPNLFYIEYFPYHSAGGFDFPDSLPSYKYSNWLVRKAMEDHKLIIIMRKEELWYDRIDGLRSYENKLLLKNHQRVWFSPGNLCRAIDIPPVMPKWACLTLDDVLKKM